MKDDEIEELKKKEQTLAKELQKSGEELERKYGEVAVKIAKKIREINALKRNQQELEDKNTELTTQIEQNDHEMEEVTIKQQELAQSSRNAMKYESMCVKNIMRDLDEAGDDARTKRKLLQYLQERTIAFSLHLSIENIATSQFTDQYQQFKNDNLKKLQEVLTKEDYDLFFTQYIAVNDASLNTLQVSVYSEKYKLLENKYDTVLNEAMQQIYKV